jgi:hypothetical protein
MHMTTHAGPLHWTYIEYSCYQRRNEEGVKTIPLKFQCFDKAEPNTQFSGKYIHNNLIKIQFEVIFKLSATPD